MNGIKGFCLAGAAVALGLACVPALAQQNTMSNQDHLMSMRLGMNSDRTLPASAADGKIMLLQMMADKGFTKTDIMKSLPLFEDLRDAERIYVFGMEDATANWATTPEQSQVNGLESAHEAANRFRDRRTQIWAALDNAIGPDKSSAIRPLVEPVRVDVSNLGYTDTHLQRIDQLISEWDKLAAARVAANGGTAYGTASTVSFESTPGATNAIAGIEFYTYPTLSSQDVINVLEMRLAGIETNGNPEVLQYLHGQEINAKSLQNVREHRARYWD